jgi:hypothetical protein
MKFLLPLLVFPCFIHAQINSAFATRSNLSYSKVESSSDGMFGFEKDGKFGYLDKNGNVVIPADYAYESSTSKTIPSFIKGFVKLKKDNKYGVLDKTGKTIIPFEYDGLYIGSYGKYVSVYNNINGKNTWGIVNMQNKILLPIVYEQFQIDSNLIGVKQNGKWGMKDISGKDILPLEYDQVFPYSQNQVILATKGTQYGFVDANGKWLFEKVKSVYTLNGCYEGMIMCSVSGKYGYLDLKGDEVIVTKYDYASSFNKLGLAKVGKKSSTSSSTTLYGYIDKKGNEVIPVKYESLGEFYSGLTYAKDPETNRYGFFDKTGKWILNPVYLDLLSFDEYGGVWVKQTDAKWHYINKTGKDLGSLDDKGTLYRYFGNQGYAVIENNNADYVLLDKNGSTVKKIDDCDAIYNFNYGVGGYKCKSTGKYGFIDINGNKITGCDFDGFEGFTEAGINKVTKTIDGKNKSGYVDAKGNIILPIVYDYVYNFRDGWGLIYKDGKYFYVDRNGNLKDPPGKYDELYEFRSGYSMAKIKGTGTDPHKYIFINKDLKEEFTVSAKQGYSVWENVAIVSRDNTTYEMMDTKGNIFKTLTGIETLSFCSDGMLAVRKNYKWGYINNKGDEIVTPKYDTCTAFKYGYGRVKLNSKWGIVDRSGTEIIQPKYGNILPGENGYFIYYDNNGWGMMDKTGKIIIQPTLSTITPFEKDRAMAKLGKTYTIIRSPLAK